MAEWIKLNSFIFLDLIGLAGVSLYSLYYWGTAYKEGRSSMLEILSIGTGQMPFQMDLCWDSPGRKIGNRLDRDVESW